MFPVLFAAGAEPTLAWLSTRGGWRRAFTVAAGIGLALNVLITLPVVPAGDLHDTPIVAINYDAGETIAWPTYVQEITSAYDALPARVRGETILLASNYGEAGALAHLGSPKLPRVFSPDNGFWLWGPPSRHAKVALAVGFGKKQLLRNFGSVFPDGHLNNHVDVSDDEQDAPLWICRGVRGTWHGVWRRMKDYSG